MNRRKFLIGAGSLAAGSAAAMGTGAFSSVSAERTATVSVASDDNSYVALNPTDQRASLNNGELELDFSSSGNGSGGLNPNSRTTFLNLFEITNQGDDPVFVAVGATQSDVYESGTGDPLLFDYSNLNGFVYNEEIDSDGNVSGTGLPFNGGSGNMEIDGGGRIRVSFDSNGSSDPSQNDQILSVGETISVSLDLILDGKDLGTGGNEKIVIGAADPDNPRDPSDGS